MNEYKISHKIKTLAELWEPFAYKGFNFRQWDFTIADGPKGEAWIVEKEIKASNLLNAINKFRKELLDIIQQCCFVSQCYFSFIPESWMVLKKNNNDENIFFLRFTKEVEAVSLHFDKEEIESLKKLDSFPRKPAFMYLNESTNAVTFYSRLAMLIITLESIAGEKSPNVTDKEFIKNKILKDDKLFDEIFARGSGIRNKIFHGKDVDITDNYIDNIYKKIVEYFNSEFGTNINLSVVDPQRIPWGNYVELRGFFKPKDQIIPDFKNVVEKFSASAQTNCVIPTDYEFLPEFKNY